MMEQSKKHYGFSLIEVIIVSAILTLFFLGIFEGIKYTLGLISDTQQRTVALTVAEEKIEYIRSLSYDAVGTVSGIPSGAIPQNSTTTLNGIDFQVRVLVEYVDDDADGIGGADSNGITTDYKQAKVIVTWSLKGDTKSIFLISNIIPRSIETSVGGGTLRVNVFNAAVQPLPGASVRVVNTTVVPNIDVTKITDATGVALFGGAPAGSNYEIYVTRSGYSADQTYKVSGSLPNPTTLPVAVLEADISTMNFFIDELSDYTIRTLSSQSVQSIKEPFSNTTGIATSTNIDISGGSAKLHSTSGTYSSSGSARLNAIAPGTLLQWGGLSIASSIPANTTATVKVYSGTSTLTLVPNSDLPGNSVGFSSGQIDLSTLSVSLYPNLTIQINLSTGNSVVTPEIDEVTVTYTDSEAALSSVSLNVVGAKTIGTDSGGNLVYKKNSTVLTSGGVYSFSDIEWDAYTVTPSGYDVAVSCAANPAIVSPGTTVTQDLLLVADTARSLRVAVQTVTGVPMTNAQVTLSRSGYTASQDSRNCGQVFFSSLTAASDYQVVVDVAGQTSKTITNVDVQGDEVLVVQF